MHKKPRVRTLMDSQHFKGSETLLKSEHQQFFYIFWLLWKDFSSENSVLLVTEVLRLFLNTLTPANKNSLSVKVSVWRKQFKYNYLQKQKCFFNFFPHFWSLHQILNIFEKNMSLIADVFPKL